MVIFVLRLNVEVSFEETRRHLGVETTQQQCGLGDDTDHAGLDVAVFAGLPDGVADAERWFVASAPVGLV